MQKAKSATVRRPDGSAARASSPAKPASAATPGPVPSGASPEAGPPPSRSPGAAPRGLVSATGLAIDPRALLFDPDWYRSEYPDVAAAGADPVRHFFDNGAREGRNPSPFFVTRWYVTTYPDVATSEMNPFLHYLLYGAYEGRRTGA